MAVPVNDLWKSMGMKDRLRDRSCIGWENILLGKMGIGASSSKQKLRQTETEANEN